MKKPNKPYSLRSCLLMMFIGRQIDFDRDFRIFVLCQPAAADRYRCRWFGSCQLQLTMHTTTATSGLIAAELIKLSSDLMLEFRTHCQAKLAGRTTWFVGLHCTFLCFPMLYRLLQLSQLLDLGYWDGFSITWKNPNQQLSALRVLRASCLLVGFAGTIPVIVPVPLHRP